MLHIQLEEAREAGVCTVSREPLATQSFEAKDLGFVNPDQVSFTQ